MMPSVLLLGLKRNPTSTATIMIIAATILAIAMSAQHLDAFIWSVPSYSKKIPLFSTDTKDPNDSKAGDDVMPAVRTRAYPESAYNLRSDENEVQYNFISFIDRSPPAIYSQVFRLVEPRIYARQDQFRNNMTEIPPTIDDVAPPPSLYGPLAKALSWNKLPARMIVGTISYLSFPIFAALLRMGLEGQNLGHNDQALSELVDQFLPGISIVLGTYISLTLSILYDRKARIQRTVALEAAMLALTYQNLMDLFSQDEEGAVEAAQCIVDQVRTLVRESRGREIMDVIYHDPYYRIQNILKERNGGNLDSVSAQYPQCVWTSGDSECE